MKREKNFPRDNAGEVSKPYRPCYSVDFTSRALGNNGNAGSREGMIGVLSAGSLGEVWRMD